MFLVAGAFAGVHIPLWLVVFSGPLAGTVPGSPFAWHAHEMLYGYAAAVISGFLLTAVRNWTAQPTPSGPPLALLVLLWLGARLALLPASPVPAWLAAVIDIAFLPAVAVAIARPLWRTRNARNAIFPIVLLAFGAANVLYHLDRMGIVTGQALHADQIALDLVVLVMIVLGGRVIPLFTRNAIAQANVRMYPLLDRAAIVMAVLLPVTTVLLPGTAWSGAVSLLTGLAVLARMHGWASFATRRVPLVWVLHAGYLWIGVGLTLRALAPWIDALPPSAATHALTAGAIATLTLGMMSRVALGHTGRPLAVGRAMTSAFLLVTLAALLRVLGPFLDPSHYPVLLGLTALAWTAAFGIFTVVYFPVLTQPRVDGTPG